MNQQAEALRQEAQQHEQNASDSFERCDTDGFLSQWASGVMAQKKRLEADLVEAGGVWTFPALFDLDGKRQPAKLIDGKYGTCWAFCNEAGNFTGEFVNFIGCAPWEGNYDSNPKGYKAALRGYQTKIRNLANRGYREGEEQAPAKVITVGRSVTSVQAIIIRTDGGYPKP
jgi:hypothetical protein